MRDPVVAADGHTYERAAIAAWIERQAAAGRPPRSPMTNERLAGAALVPNHVVKAAVRELLGPAAAAAPR